MNEASDIPAGVDTGRPTPARIYDYMLQGSNYFAADRMAAEQILAAAPEIRDAAWSNRGFHQRAANWMAEHGRAAVHRYRFPHLMANTCAHTQYCRQYT